eukprot:CAMPEP_0118653512 /NCGR_PEP_ID=MMETSP0785-20121206/11868_1 /TAXON_ID=91992 /ORGANISM="Bolidomonas pacifica, Strain CCMP 1866" /LENGTH=1235 /DNA_ID=CAMNT_0006546055 /DNA_START=468 /DNA_END=4173 /DNA_ORIENTATION=+
MSESEHPDNPNYTSSSDVETSSRKSSLPRPHKSMASPSLASRKSKGSGGRMMLAQASMDSARSNKGENLWNSHGSMNSLSSGISNVPTPNSQSTMMFKGLDTFEAGVGGGGGYGSGYESPYGNGRHTPQHTPRSQTSPFHQPQPQQRQTYQQSQAHFQQQQHSQYHPQQQQQQQHPYQHQPYAQQQQQNRWQNHSARDIVRGAGWQQQQPPQLSSQHLQPQQRHYLQHSQSASPRMLVRGAERGANLHQEVVDYASDSGYNVGRNSNVSGYNSDTGHRQMHQIKNYGASNGYSSDTGYRNTSVVAMPRPNRSTSQPVQVSVHDGYNSDAPPSTIQRDDSGRSIMSGITMNDESDERITSPSSWDEDGVESFHINADLWNVYESEGYPYYLRMRDNHSQWDDPRVVGVEGEEEEAASAPAPAPAPALVPVPPPQPGANEMKGAKAAIRGKIHKNLTVETPYNTQPPNNPLTSPTTMPGVGATFINVNMASPANQSSSGVKPPHPHQPLLPEPKPPVSAEEVFARKAVHGDGFVEAKSDFEDEFEEAEEGPTPEKTKNPLAAMLQERIGGARAEAKTSGSKHLEAMLKAKAVANSKSEVRDEEEAKIDSKSESKVESKITCTKEDLMQDDKIKKYVKMASVGVPAESVAKKMESDGIESSKIRSFRVVFNIEIDEVDEKPQAEEKFTAPLTKEELMEIPELTKYMKMQKMGIPPPAVSQKMAKDGVSPGNISKFENTFGLASASPSSSLGVVLPPAKRRTTVKMTKVHMNQISSDKLKNSLWAADDANDDENELAKDDIKALEEAFGQSNIAKSPNKTGGSKAAPLTPSKAKEVSLVDGKRAYNVNIGLAQFKSTFGEDFDSLMEAIVSLDESKLNLENLANLRSLLPTPNEMRQVGSYNGERKKLGKCERFFIAAQTRPGISEIARSFYAILSFPESYAICLEKFNAVNFACEQIVKSKSLTFLLRKVLAVGNLMNEANNKPKVSGITLESLVKICLTKGSNKKITVMDHVVQMFIEKEGVEGELTGLKEGGRVKSIKSLYEELDELKSGSRMIEECCGGAGKAAPAFVAGANKFLGKASILLAKLEEASSSTKKSTAALYRYFGEDEKRTECSFIISVLTQFVGLVKKSKETYVRRKRRKMLEKEREERRAAAATASENKKGSPPPAVGGQFGTRRGQARDRKMPPPPRPPPTNPNHSFNTNLLEKAMDDRRRSIQGYSQGESKVGETKGGEQEE